MSSKKGVLVPEAVWNNDKMNWTEKALCSLIAANPRATNSELAARMKSTDGTIAFMVSSLVKENVLSTFRDSKGRVLTVTESKKS